MGDDGPLVYAFPNYWTVLCDKWYYGAECSIVAVGSYELARRRGNNQ